MTQAPGGAAALDRHRAGFLRGLAGRVTDPSLTLLLTQLVAAGAAAVVNVLAARALDPSGRGVLALLLQIAYLSSQGLLLGTDRSVVAAYHGQPTGTVAREHGRLLRLPAACGALAAGVLCLVPLADLTSWRAAVVVTTLFAVVNAFVRAARAVAIAGGRHGQYVKLVVVNQVSLTILLGGLYIVGTDDVTTWLAGYLVAGSLPTLVFFIVNIAASSDTSDHQVERRRVARREGVALLPAAMANAGMLRADRLVLPVLSSAAALGIYASVATMTELLAWPVQAYADSRLGVWRSAHERGRLAVVRTLGAATGFCICAGTLLGLVTHAVIVPLFGAGYEPAQALVAPLVVAAGVYGVAQVAVTLLIARRRNALASAAEGAGFGVSLVGYLLLIPWLGALGAAYGSILGYGTSLAVCLVALSRAGRA